MGVIDAQLELMPTDVLTQLHFFRRSVDGGVLIPLPCETYLLYYIRTCSPSVPVDVRRERSSAPIYVSVKLSLDAMTRRLRMKMSRWELGRLGRSLLVGFGVVALAKLSSRYLARRKTHQVIAKKGLLPREACSEDEGNVPPSANPCRQING